MLILIVKWIHVLAAVTAVGANITYGVWISRAETDPRTLPFVLRNISWIDRRIANPCYGLLLITGLTMALTIPIPLTTPWLLTALVLYVTAALLGILAYAPATRRQLALAESVGFDSPDYKSVASRSRVFGLIVTLDVVVIIFLMVVKPALW